jgi:SagB-type dehydrogenase family enzyme
MDQGSGAHKLNTLRELYRRDMDLRAALPKVPRLVPEVVTERFGRDRLLIYGAKDPVVFRTPRGEVALSELLQKVTNAKMDELLAGTLTTEDQSALFDLIVSLTRAGLLEDDTDHRPADSPLSSFLGRYVGASACNSNRSQALARLAQSRICCGVRGIETDWLFKDLSASGFASVVVETAGNIQARSLETATHALFIANGGDALLRNSILRAHELQIPYLVVRVGTHECQVGPFVLPGFTAGYDCLTYTLEPPEGQASACDAQFWAAYAVHMMTTLIVQLVIPQLNQVQRIFAFPGAPRETVVIPLMPGSATSPIAADDTYENNPALRKVWAHHVGLRRPPRSILSPLTHFNHFTSANIARTKMSPRRYYGRQMIPLPEAASSGTPPWLNDVPAARRSLPLTLDGLSAILRAMTGYADNGGALRRITPSGGGLESPEAYLYVREVEGVPEGGYRYFGPSHALEPLPHLDWNLICDSLGLSQQCAIISVAWFDKVRGKYGDFGYSVVHYDSGVAAAFAQLVCEARGFDVTEIGIEPAMLSRALDLVGLDNEYLPTCAFAVGARVECSDGRLPSPLQDLIKTAGAYRPSRTGAPALVARRPYSKLRARGDKFSLDEVFLTRRSVNTFANEVVPAGLIRELLRIASDAAARSERCGAPAVNVTPLLLRRCGDDELGSGVYTWNAQEDALATRRIGLSSEQLSACINQIGLATAGDIVVMLGDIPDAVNRSGEAGYRALLLRAGNMVAHMWLAAHAAGLSSTAAGGVLEPGLSVHAGCDGYRECPMLSFAIGTRRWLPA